MSEEKLDSNVNDTPEENSAAPEQQEKSFDDNVEIIDYDIDDKITVKDFENNERKPAKKKESFDLKAEIISWIKMIIAAAVIAAIIVEFIIINATVPTGSMERTILPGDRILGSRLT